MFDAMLTSAFHNVKSADEVAFHVRTRVLQRVSHPGLSGQMYDNVRLFSFKESGQGVHVFQACLHARKMGVLFEHAMAALFQSNVVIIRHPVKADDIESFVEQ